MLSSIVKLHAHTVTNDVFIPFEKESTNISIGTAFFISSNVLLTCYHCVENATKLFISTPEISKKEYEVFLLSAIPENDIAVISTNGKEEFKHDFMQLGDSNTVKQLDYVVAIGYPLDSDSVKFTKGVVSGKYHEHLQIDASINPGNSGGPLLLGDKVIGINSSKLSEGESMGLSIPINYYKKWQQYISKKKQPYFLTLPTLDIKYTLLGEKGLKLLGVKKPGIMVVKSNVPEIKLLDIILSVNGYEVDTFGQVTNNFNKIAISDYISTLVYDTKLEMIILRNKVKIPLTLEITHEKFSKCGIQYEYVKYDYYVIGGIVIMPLLLNHLENLKEQEISSKLKNKLMTYTESDKQVFFISKILVGSPIESLGIIKTGMVIYEINNIKPTSISHIKTIVESQSTLIIHTTSNTLFIYPRIELQDIDAELRKKYNY